MTSPLETLCTTARRSSPRFSIDRMNSEANLRVAVVEVGSRAVRLLVADVSSSRLEPVLTRSAEIPLMQAIQKAVNQTLEAFQAVHLQIREFREAALVAGAKQIAVVGTEAVRTVARHPILRNSPYLLDIEILDEESEAFSSLIAAVWGVSSRQPADVLVVDQGSGSMELVTGSCVPLTMYEARSFQLGSDTLVRNLKASNWDISRFRGSLRPMVEAAQSLRRADVNGVIALGSAATKCAWLRERRDIKERYDPRRVQGKVLSVRELEDTVSLVAGVPSSRWAPMRAIVEPRRPQSDELERVITGAIVLLLLLQCFDQRELVVSAYGTRHGIAWQLAAQTELPACK